MVTRGFQHAKSVVARGDDVADTHVILDGSSALAYFLKKGKALLCGQEGIGSLLQTLNRRRTKLSGKFLPELIV